MMLYRALKIFLNFFTIFYCVAGETLITKKNEKRISSRNNYQMCLDSFDIHRDTIIRTHDSRDMGAKYLNEIDVESREECLKYCCDTEGCDVFIFEEKKPGSCYLFQCGPLHDFKCKFTSHANYSSAVRTNYNTQNNAQVEEEIRISQQEHELKSLRKLADPVPVEYSFTESPVKLAATLAPKLILTTPLPVKPVCSRNQYECRSSGDCIAIYNVCDGIPQCADGSDEAADLVCPTEKPTSSPSMIQGPPPLPADIIKYQQMIDQRKPLAPIYAHGPEPNAKSWELSNLAHQVVPQQQNFLYPAQQADVSQSRKVFGAPGYQWDYQPLYEQSKDSYNPVNSFHEQNNMNVNYEQDQSHIFNRKGSNVAGEKEEDSGAYMDSKHPYTSRFSLSNRGPWQDTQALPSPSVIPNVQQQQQINEAGKSVVSTAAPPCDIPHEQKSVSVKSKETSKTNKKLEQHISHDKVVNQDIKKPNAVKSDTSKHHYVQTKESKGAEHKSLILIEDHTREHGRGNIIAEHLKQTNENEVLRPRGAVISLTLGLAITAITATLIACRLQVVRRRGRRHGPYAHDADYLVNGMYL